MEKSSQDEIIRAYMLLKSLRKNIENIVSIQENYVNEYHSILDKLESNAGISLSEFRIPDSEIRQVSRSYIPGGEQDYSEEKYVARTFMFTKMDAVLGYFEFLTSPEPKRMGFRKPAK